MAGSTSKCCIKQLLYSLIELAYKIYILFIERIALHSKKIIITESPTNEKIAIMDF